MIWVLLLALAALMFYGGVLIMNAQWEAKSSPKVPMFTCDRHGTIPESVLLHLEGASDKPIPYCPFCWQQKAKEIKEKGLPRIKAE